MTDLVVARLDHALRLLDEADTAQKAKAIADIAAAAETYARRQRLGEEAIGRAHSIKVEAMRRLGVMLQGATKNTGAAGSPGPGRGNAVPIENRVSDAPTLADLGIDKKTSAVAQKLAALPPEHFKQVRDGATTITRAVAAVVRERNAELKREQPSAPHGRYDCIVIDPPWQMEKIERDVRPNQVAFDYPTMEEAELAAFDVGGMAADSCHLFCWTTHKHLPMALRLLDAWGFRYVCTMVWHKPGGFQPIGLPQYNCEFVLYARRGSPAFADTKAFPCCFEAPRREHSRKPDEFYALISRVTDGPRIDVFSREPREGFAQYGNETQKFAA